MRLIPPLAISRLVSGQRGQRVAAMRAALAPVFGLAGIGLAIAVVATAALLVDRLVRTEARMLIQSELAAVAAQAVRGAEIPISGAAQILVEMARAGPIDCLPATVAGFGERAKKTSTIVAFDVVDASGFLMCSSAEEPARPARLLPELSPREPSITLAPDPRRDKRGLLVAATIAHGVRLVAELAPDVPAMPAGPAFAGDRLSVTLSITGRGLWRRTGATGAENADLPSGRAESAMYPLVAEAVADADVAPAGFRRIQLAVVVCGGLAVGAILLLGLSRRGKQQRRQVSRMPKPVARPVPLYRPVIEIETGAIVGVDVVLTTNAAGDPVFDAPAAEQVLAEMAPVLHAHPGLMLSLPPALTRGVLDEIVAALTRQIAKHGVDARQIVLTARPRAAAAAATIDAIGAAGARFALDGVLSSEGGLMALAAHQPDFITCSGEVLGGERELAILHAAAGLARNFGIGVVVREVELPEHVEWLRAVGVTTATGPAFGHALNARSVAELVAAAGRGHLEAQVA
jgi:EAL domain-containing protein (putative c-di-GMP-specific phosphodiesterase class I)